MKTIGKSYKYVEVEHTKTQDGAYIHNKIYMLNINNSDIIGPNSVALEDQQ